MEFCINFKTKEMYFLNENISVRELLGIIKKYKLEDFSIVINSVVISDLEEEGEEEEEEGDHKKYTS